MVDEFLAPLNSPLLTIIFSNWLCITLVGEGMRQAFILRRRFDFHLAALIAAAPYLSLIGLSLGLPPLLAILAAALVLGVVNLGADSTMGRIAPAWFLDGAQATIVSVGLMFAGVNLIAWWGGSQSRTLPFDVGVQDAVSTVIIFSALVVVAVGAVLRTRFRLDLSERAALFDRTLLLLRGFPLNKVAAGAAVGAGVAASLAATLRATETAFSPYSGLDLTLLAVAAAYTGPSRGLVGLGLSAALLAAAVGTAEYALDDNWSRAAAFATAAVMLLARRAWMAVQAGWKPT